MKNYIYISVLVMIGSLIACDPLSDEIDAINEDYTYSNDLAHTLIDDDYDVIDDECDCTPFGSFSSEEDAKAFIPAALDDRFPALEKGSSAVVTYAMYNGSSPDLRGVLTEFTIPTTDYDLFHNDTTAFDTFSNADQEVIEYVNWKGFTGEDGDYMDITFDYYDGSFHGGAVSRLSYTVAYGWQYTWILPQEVYDFFGESSTDFTGVDIPDFSYEDEASEVLHIYLNEFMSLFAEDGDKLVAQYNFDNNNEDVPPTNPTEQGLLLYIYNGAEWIAYGDGYQTTEETMSFGHNGTEWVADNTLKYSLTGDDYGSIGEATASSNPDGSESLIKYGNFDFGLWTSAQIEEELIKWATIKFPGVEGQKYLLTYATWEPGSGTGTLYIIFQGGEYVIFETE